MIGHLGALTKNRDCIVAVLVYSFASRLIYGFAILHAALTTTKPQVPVSTAIPAKKFQTEAVPKFDIG
jgi:hypothetical protein